jgi:hypothetical protein
MSILCFIAAFKSFGNVIDYLFMRIGNPELYRYIPRNVISSMGPFALYLLLSIILWLFATKLAGKLVSDAKHTHEANYEGILQIGIGLLGLYMLTMDVAGILWTIRDFVGEQTGLIHEEGMMGVLFDIPVDLINLAISFFLVYKAGWISRKLHMVWKKGSNPK